MFITQFFLTLFFCSVVLYWENENKINVFSYVLGKQELKRKKKEQQKEKNKRKQTEVHKIYALNYR